jgi:hypothetical protein
MFPFDSLRFHYRRWRALRDAERGLASPTASERAAIAVLRDGFRQLPVERTDGLLATEADWAGAMNRLRELGLTADPRAFQRWDVVIARMAPTSSPETPIELAALQAHPEWDTRWRVALRDVPIGRPNSYAGYPESSEILIQTVHHVMRLEALAGRRVDECDVIVELGGGFGGLCRVMHALGFCGRYLLYDLPPFALLQRYFLSGAGIFLEGDERVRITSDFAELESFVSTIQPADRAAFWATWSLSETPVALRERVKPLVERIGHYCIGYQGAYGEVDNVAFFTDCWLTGPRQQERIAHRPNDYYLAGALS